MLRALLVCLRAIGRICRGHQVVALANLALRQQLAALTRSGKRPHLRSGDRLCWIGLAHGWRDWRRALVIVPPDTVVRWHREWLRRRWTARSRAKRGRPPVEAAIRRLVAQMAAANPLWGAPRLQGELRKLGIDVSERTVSRRLGRRHRPSGQTWRTVLTNHVPALVSMDVCTVPTVTGRVLFVLVLLAHHRRRIVHVGITDHPTAAWTAPQIIEAFPDDTAPRWRLWDRDTIYRDAFRRRVAGMGISEVVGAPSSPWQNPYAERLIGSLRRDGLDHLIVLSEAPLRRVLALYVSSYQRARTPLSLAKDAPVPRRVPSPTEGRVIAFPEVGGLHHRYERRTA